MKTIVMHHQISGGVSEVDKWLNENGHTLDKVQITFMYNPRGSKYMVFYEVAVDEK